MISNPVKKKLWLKKNNEVLYIRLSHLFSIQKEKRIEGS